MRRLISGRAPRRRRLAVVASTIVAAGLSVGVTAAHATVAAPVRAGDAVVVDSSDGSHQLSHGQSATKFSLRLPAGAACPGDSANDQWRVQSFIVPATDDPAKLRYTTVAPAGDGRYALYDVQTHPLINSLTQQNATAGQPGIIPAVPPLSFAVFPPGTLPSGTYRVGIACTLFRETASYWDTELVLTARPSDKPGRLVWRLASEPQNVVSNSSNGSSLGVVIASAGVAVAAVAVGFLVWRRHNRNTRTTRTASKSPNTRKAVSFSKEPQ